jgi:hypothetical protein
MNFFVVYLAAFLNCLMENDIRNEFERQPKILSRHFPGGVEENHKIIIVGFGAEIPAFLFRRYFVPFLGWVLLIFSLTSPVKFRCDLK